MAMSARRSRVSGSSPWWGKTEIPMLAPTWIFSTSTSKDSSRATRSLRAACAAAASRSEEHTSELQSRFDLVCRLLLEKKKKQPESGFLINGASASDAAAEHAKNEQKQ